MKKLVKELFQHLNENKTVFYVSDLCGIEGTYQIDSIKYDDDSIRLSFGDTNCHIDTKSNYSKEDDEEYGSVTYFFTKNGIEVFNITFF